jgi:hypothetical protein
MSIVTFQAIEKEKIEDLKFPSAEVLGSSHEIAERKNDLERALKLGNMEQHKIKIFFQDDSSMKSVETTVWGVTDKRVILKQGVVIPIHRVHSIKV